MTPLERDIWAGVWVREWAKMMEGWIHLGDQSEPPKAEWAKAAAGTADSAIDAHRAAQAEAPSRHLEADHAASTD